MKKQTPDDLIPRDGMLAGCALGILIPAICVFVYFLSLDGSVPGVDWALLTLVVVGVFTAPLGMVIGEFVAVSLRFSEEDRKKAYRNLAPRLAGIVGLILGFWIPATMIYNNAEHPLPGILNGLCIGSVVGTLGTLCGTTLVKLLLKYWSR